jgi:galactose mutarotase-like enzyme
VIPAHGARIAQITDALGNNWLTDTGSGELTDGAPVLFAGGTRGGWDECLPSVSACPDPNRPGFDVADHGDFWAARWSVDSLEDGAVVMVSDLPHHPLQVRKTVTLTPDREEVEVEVEIGNRSGAPYRFLYSAHPLFAFEHDTTIEIPGAGDVVTGFGPDWPDPLAGEWPLLVETDGRSRDLSQIPYLGELVNHKVFVRWAGQVRMSVPALGSSMLMRQPGEENPWLGLCVNRAAYPSTAEGDRWIALEPTTAPTDSLVSAVECGSDVTIAAGGSRSWTTKVEILHDQGDR